MKKYSDKTWKIVGVLGLATILILSIANHLARSSFNRQLRQKDALIRELEDLTSVQNKIISKCEKALRTKRLELNSKSPDSARTP